MDKVKVVVADAGEDFRRLLVETLNGESDLTVVEDTGDGAETVELCREKQGDVVVLRKSSFMTEPIVKRVIAVAGQHVQVDYATGQVYVDGEALDEPYINEVMVDPLDPLETVLDVTVPEGSIYVMGDNRNHSADSRFPSIGIVDVRCVIGRGVAVMFPFGHWKGL